MKCSEAREVEVESEAGGGGCVFRVRVSLERYFSDERARCYMSVSRTRPVRALARRLRRAFRLPRPFALLSRGYLLPPDEPLALLDPDDPVEVIPVKSSEHLVVEINEDSHRLSPEASPPRPPLSTAIPLAVDEPDRAVEPDPPPSEPCVAPAAAEPCVASPESAPRELSECRAVSADLEDMKRRALKLLDEHEEPPRRRRRVRRRRRAPPGPAAAPAGEEPAMEPEGLPTERSRTPAPPVVLRNGVTSPRAARLVRPLPGPPAAPPAPALVPAAPAPPPPAAASIPPDSPA